MPIKLIALQRRFAEQGRIRLGYKQGGNGRPVKLEKFRFTSPSEQHIKDLAQLYGGDPKPWDNNGKPEFEVYSDVKSIPVIAVKGGLTQWLETWSGGGCVHRCDGELNVLTNEPCNPDDPAHLHAKPTTRLSLMLPELESIGVWRMESHGWNAAAEIPAVAELAQFVGDLVPATLDLVERRAIKDGKTSRFVVPVLDLKIATHRLRELVEAKVNGAAGLPSADGERPALEAAKTPGEDPYEPYFERLAAATTVAECQVLWAEMRDEHLVGSQAEITARSQEFFEAFKAKGTELNAGDPAEANPDGTYDAELVPDPQGDADADAVWQQVLLAGGERGMELDQVLEDFKARMGGLLPDDASASELQSYLDELSKEPAA
jgi:hypothetical protein